MENPYYDAGLHIIVSKFFGTPSLEEFKKIAEPALPKMEKYKVTKLLTDTSDLELNSIENQEWTQRVWYPRAIELGLKYFAFVVSDNIFGEASTEQTNETVENKGLIKIKYFKTRKHAIDWLKACD